MADAPPVEYLETTDGTFLAYQVLGSGSPTLLTLHGLTFSIDAIDEEPRWSAFDRRLAAIGRLVRFDRRGIGLTDSGGGPSTIETWISDSIAVLDHVQSGPAVVVGTTTGSLAALLLAAEHSDHVSHLVVVNGYARTVRSDDYPVGVPARVIDRFLSEATTPTGGSVDDLALIAPSLVDDARTRQWWHRATHRAAGPVTAQAMLREGTLKDVRDRLSRITVPTLVMHRRDNALIRVEHGRYLAEHIEGVRYVELEGADHAAWAGDSDAVLDEIERFLGASSGAGIGRRVATLLFTDVVGSTQEAARLGDRRWRERLDGHDATIRDQVERHGGRVVKFTGDGMLADFPSPSLAVAAARDLRAAVDLPVRIGVHAGEVELRGEDVSGLAVHIASRVQAHAHPGEILLSRTVCDLLAGSRLTFIPRGTHALKGVPGEWPLYALGDS